jgi:hypothetical protein
LSPPPQVLADKPTSAIAAAAATIRNFLMRPLHSSASLCSAPKL